jgi:uncharacterized protein with HEPN domain
MSRKTETDYLRDILHYAEEAVAIVDGRVRADLDQDKSLRYAVQHCFTIIGEASSRVSQTMRDRFPEVPWPEIIGMRNWIVHRYDRIDYDVLWKTTTEDLPDLIEKILDFLPSEQT